MPIVVIHPSDKQGRRTEEEKEEEAAAATATATGTGTAEAEAERGKTQKAAKQTALVEPFPHSPSRAHSASYNDHEEELQGASMRNHSTKQKQQPTANPSPSYASSSSSSPTPMKFIPVAQLYSPPLLLLHPPPSLPGLPALALSAPKKPCRKLPFNAPPDGDVIPPASLVYRRRHQDREQDGQDEEEEEEEEEEIPVVTQVQYIDATLPDTTVAQTADSIMNAAILRIEDKMAASLEKTDADPCHEEALRENSCSIILPPMQNCVVNREDTSVIDLSEFERPSNHEGSEYSDRPMLKFYVRKHFQRRKRSDDVEAQNLRIEQTRTTTFTEHTKTSAVGQIETKKGLSNKDDGREKCEKPRMAKPKFFCRDEIFDRIATNSEGNAFRKEWQVNKHGFEMVANDTGNFDRSTLRNGKYTGKLAEQPSLPHIQSLVVEVITNDIDSSSLSVAVDNSFKEQIPASTQNVPLSEASLAKTTSREVPNWISPGQKLSGIEEKQNKSIETNVELTESRSEQKVNMGTERAEMKTNYLPARKKRKMQRVNALVSPMVGAHLNDKAGCNLPNGHLVARAHFKVLPNLGLNSPSQQRKWKCVNVAAADPTSLIGRSCRVYWPLESNWFSGVIRSYDRLTGKHHVEYDDGDSEDLILADENVKLCLSLDEMVALNLQLDPVAEERKKLDYEEMAVLAGTRVEDFIQNFGHGELVWAKIKGHPMWPAFVMDEEHADACGLETHTREGLLPVQFFGSYDYARISAKHAFPFSQGLLHKFQLKCKRLAFERGLEEAERYLKDHILPEGMSQLQDEALNLVPEEENGKENETSEEDEDFMGDERMHKIKKSMESLFTCPIKLGSLQVLNLGKIVKDSEHFHNEHHIWTEGYTAIRKFTSTKDPRKRVGYKMEVIKNPSLRSMPLFRVTPYDSDQVEGPTPSSCWRKIFRRLHRVKQKYGLVNSQRQHQKSGAFMFGFSNRRILKLIQALPNARMCSKFTGWLDKSTREKSQDLLPAGYRPVKIDWKHPDRCSVCYLDEEYVNNMFLQCDKCRMLVHMHCYGELESPDGHLWLCKLCRPGAPTKIPPCCLCPVEGGAMKKTTDGRWAHLACAMWVPETCLVDIKRMEPIDGLNSINKDRWKLTCSICRVPYGVCIQCSEFSCCVAYHILCARAAGLVTEVQEDFGSKDKGISEEHDRPICLLSYCRRHRQPKEERHPTGPHLEGSHSTGQDCSTYCPPQNTSGCARCEPFDSAARRGRQEPEALAAAAAKRLYVEKMPFLVSGIHRQEAKGDLMSALPCPQETNGQATKSVNSSDSKARDNSSSTITVPSVEDAASIFSMSERYKHMRSTMSQRLTFGKSGIHGWGIFTKQQHRAGDMVIEYAGEIVRPIVADIRERCFYNSLVGAGTYMFRIDDERVVDATRAGSIAHLINHACEPNCYSRVISVSGVEHIIIFAKRDIEEGEELAYDYRFTSKGEKLACYCGFPRCRGSVNANDADEEPTRICVPHCDLTEWVPTTSS